MPFSHRTTVRFSQVDAAGILYFSRALELCHEAFEAFLADRGMPLSPQQFRGGGVLLPIVHAEVDFSAPMRLGDEVEVQVSVGKQGTSSITFSFRLLGHDGALRATAHHVHVATDPATFAAVPLPEAVRALGAP